MIDAKDVQVEIGGQIILREVGLHVRKGSMTAIIGPNGAGKSTLLAALSGVTPLVGGEVRLKGRPLKAYTRKALAQWLAVLQQEGLPKNSFSVREVVGMGRFPFQNWLGDEQQADTTRIVEEALQAMDLSALADRRLDGLSGGERQRVALAKVIAQQPELLMLDEPTTYLDIGYQMLLLDTVRRWQQEKDLTVVAVLHDLNLAAQYCDQLILLAGGRVKAAGTPQEVLQPSLLREVYGAEAHILPHPVSGRPQMLLQPGVSWAKTHTEAGETDKGAGLEDGEKSVDKGAIGRCYQLH